MPVRPKRVLSAGCRTRLHPELQATSHVRQRLCVSIWLPCYNFVGHYCRLNKTLPTYQCFIPVRQIPEGSSQRTLQLSQVASRSWAPPTQNIQRTPLIHQVSYRQRWTHLQGSACRTALKSTPPKLKKPGSQLTQSTSIIIHLCQWTTSQSYKYLGTKIGYKLKLTVS